MENISSLDVPTIGEMLQSVRIFTEYVKNPPDNPLYEHNASIEKTEE